MNSDALPGKSFSFLCANFSFALLCLAFSACDGCESPEGSDAGPSTCVGVTCSLNEVCSMESGIPTCTCITTYHRCEGVCVSETNLCISDDGGIGGDGGGDGGGGVPEPCDPTQAPYCIDYDTLAICESPGTEGISFVPCGLNFVCTEGQCVPQICAPGLVFCQDGDVHTCNELGTASSVMECPDDGTGSTCYQGECLPACEIAVLTASYIGCEYYSADLSNLVSPTGSNGRSFAIALANTNQDTEAVVTVENTIEVVDVVTVPTDGVVLVEIPQGERNMNLHDTIFSVSTPGGSGVWERLYHITSNIPIVSYQFNPLETIGSAASDASLLIPTHVLDTQYLIMGYEHGGFSSSKPNFVIYTTEPDTTVTIDVPMLTAGSNPNSLVEFADLVPGQPFSFTLEPMQAFSLFCRYSTPVKCDFTGASVIADKPIGVISGGWAQVPSDTSYADHTEEHLIPRQKWGSKYIVPKSRDRWGTEDRIRIMADQDDTEVHFNPDINAALTLQEGEWTEISIFQPVVIEADKPIQIGQYLVGSQHGNNPRTISSEGDPSFWIVPPTEQFRPDYVFYVPSTYTTDYLAIMFQGSPQITLDGVLLNAGSQGNDTSDAGIINTDAGSGAEDAGTVDAGSSLEPIAPGTNYYVIEVPIEDGAHVLKANQPIGLVIYGFGGPRDLDPNEVQNVSYGYVGGLNLVTINPKD